MTLSDLMSHEWKTRLSRPAALVSLVLFTLVLAYGAASGSWARNARLQAITSHQTVVAASTDRWLSDLRALEEQGAESGVNPWSGSAMDVTFASHLPPAPLGDFAIGQSDLLPYVGGVSLWDPDIRVFSKYGFEDPVALALGAFDLGKGIIFLLPLLLIVISFDILSSERDAKRLGLILAQGARVRQLVWRRLLLRSGAVLLVTVLVSLAALLLPGGDYGFAERWPWFVNWLACAMLYGAFWISIIGFVASRNRSGEVNVMVLLLAWAGFTLVLPASVTALAEALYPSPSRVAYLAETREIENETQLSEADIENQFVIDHPEMLADETSEIPDYVRTAFFVTSTVDEATKPVLAGFEDAAAKRQETLGVLRYLSPAIIVHGVFNDIAGTSSSRHYRYMAEARALKVAYAQQVGPYIVAGRRLPLAEVANMPEFKFQDEGVGTVFRHNLAALLFLGVMTLVLGLLADRRLCRIEGPGD